MCCLNIILLLMLISLYILIQIVKNTHANSVEDVYHLSTKNYKEARMRPEPSE